MRNAEARVNPEARPVRVSYVLSTRNRADHLDRALAGARAFVDDGDELIVVDGGSTDHTAAVVAKHRDLVGTFISEPDTGEAHGLNRGVLRARGHIIKQLTDDDHFYPDAMRAAIAALEADPSIDALMCGGEACEFDPATGETRLVEYRFLPAGLRLKDDVGHILRFTQCGLGLVLTRRGLERAGLFDTSFRAVDTDYMARLIACGADFRYMNVKLFRHVTYPHSGQNRGAECVRDRARVLLRSGDWPRVFGELDPRALGEALGMGGLPHGESLARLLWVGEWMRRGPLGPLLDLVAGTLRACARALAACLRLLGRSGPGGGVRGGDTDLTVEPEWDGSLR
ncbi:MAG TPA: glycosyltransferase [Candidatus Polarisedimenticolia bacterium]|nr:glycosyltransferase [Candidatus Polarisedimenticolia bacterium]